MTPYDDMELSVVESYFYEISVGPYCTYMFNIMGPRTQKDAGLVPVNITGN